MSEYRCDVLIVGGGVGGCAAAMAATSMGRKVILTEPTAWLGGQLTSQAVPSDEHPWIEQFGCTGRYRAFRDQLRRYYRDHYPLSSAARANQKLNPGGGYVSRICAEPRPQLAVIEQMLAYPRSCGLLDVWLGHEPIAADTEGDRVRSVTLRDLDSGDERTVTAEYVLDATELGDLLPLAGVEYVSGAESKSDTGELHAADGDAQPDNVQAITWCFAMGYDPTPGADHRGDAPSQYQRWRDYVPATTPPWSGPLLSWIDIHPQDAAVHRQLRLFDHEASGDDRQLWAYRKIVCAAHFDEPRPHEVTLVNWPINDYFEGNLIDQPADAVSRYLEESKQLSLSLFHWLQTEAPNPTTGGQGYPGLYLCPDMVGTRDGLAMAPYIRESRRIRARFTVTEQHVGTEMRYGINPTAFNRDAFTPDTPMFAERFDDSVGVGSYRIDLHPSTGGDNYLDVSSLPFQIPLGALLPQRVQNLLPACKNIGTTHITNGCYRLHPVEWNIGESAGLLAAYCLKYNTQPHAVHEDATRLSEFQKLLCNQGVELEWPTSRPV